MNRPSRRKHAPWIIAWTVSLALAFAATATPASAAALQEQQPEQQKDQEKEVVVKPPELARAMVRSPESVCQRPSTVVCEDFERANSSSWSDYKDYAFGVDGRTALGGKKSLRQAYDEGQTAAGWLGWHFGDHPEGGARRGEKFEQIYFRFYHRFQKDWPDRFPTRFVRIGSRYEEGELLYAWEEQLLITGRQPGGVPISTPISSIEEPAGTRHTGGNLRWLAKEPLDVRLAEWNGEWVVIEARVKLNAPGRSDGRITYWLNGETVLDRSGLNLRGAYTATTINLAVLEGNWPGGALRDGLRRWFDNVVIATEPVGCAVFTVRKKELEDQSAWRLQVATAADEAAVVWDSGDIAGAGAELDITEGSGTFTAGANRCVLPSGGYVMRARHAVGDTWSAWSDWSPMF